MSKFEEGRQPCANFKPQRDGNGYAEWDNLHECFGPFNGTRTAEHCCNGMVSFCENCHRDHHTYGWDTCPQLAVGREQMG